MWSPHRRWYLWLIGYFQSFSVFFILLSAWISETTSTLFTSHDCLYHHHPTFALCSFHSVHRTFVYNMHHCTVVYSSALFYIQSNDDGVCMSSYDTRVTSTEECLPEGRRSNAPSIPTNSLHDDDMAGLQFSRIRRRTGTNARTPRYSSPVLRSTFGRQTTEPHNGYPETSQNQSVFAQAT